MITLRINLSLLTPFKRIARFKTLSSFGLRFLGATSSVVLLTLPVLADPPVGSGYGAPVFQDEFNGNNLDSAVWSQDHGDPENVFVSDGKLHLKMLDDNSVRVYTTDFQQRFGYFEADIQAGADTALVAAFWTNTPHEHWIQDTDRSEINILESHETDSYSTDHHDWAPISDWPLWLPDMQHPHDKAVHHANGQLLDGNIPAEFNLQQESHLFGLEWTTDNQLHFFFDGWLVRSVSNTTTNAWNSLIPHEVLFTSWIFPDAGIPGPNIGETQMDINYVRIYQKPGWTAPSNGAWSNPSNWGPDGVPGVGNTAVFNQPATVGQVDLDLSIDLHAIYFDTAEIPEHTITGSDLRLGSLQAEPNTISGSDGVGGITVNNSVIRSQTIDSNIVGQRRLQFSNLTANTSDVALNLLGSIDIVPDAPEHNIVTMGAGPINIEGQISENVVNLNKDGRGVLRLAGPNEYSGVTNVKDGTLIIASDSLKNQPGALGKSIAEVRTTLQGDDPNNRANLDVRTRDVAILIEGPHEVGRDIFIGNYNYNGTTTLGGSTADTAKFSGKITVSRPIILTVEDGGTVSFSGPLVDNPNCQEDCSLQFFGAITKVGAGTASLDSIASYAGPTIVDEGVLLVNGSTHADSDVIVNSGATLGGKGKVFGQVAVSGGGIFAPGESAGGIELGSLNLLAESITTIELGGYAAGVDYDQVHLVGAGSLAGKLQVSLLPNFLPQYGDVFELLTSNGGLSGQFDSMQVPSLTGNLGWRLENTGSSLILQVVLSGDFNSDGMVTGSDFLKWQRGQSPNLLSSLDLAAWQANYGAGQPISSSTTSIPEPTTFVLLGPALMFVLRTRSPLRQVGVFLVCMACILSLCNAAEASDVELYAINSYSEGGQFPQFKSDLLRVDSATGSATFVAELTGTGAATLYAIDFSSHEQLYGVTFIGDLVTIDVLTGAVSFVGTPGGPGSPFHVFGQATAWGLAFSPADEPYVFASNGVSRSLMKLDLSDGTVELSLALASIPLGFPSWSTIDFGPDGTLYGNSPGLFTVDVVSGTATSVVRGYHPDNGFSLDITADGVFRGAIQTVAFPTEQWGLATIDPASGEATIVSAQNNLPGGIVGLASRPIQNSADFDMDGDIDGRDFLIWQRGESPSPLSASDLAAWRENFGTLTLQAAASTTVLEPASHLLIGLTAIISVMLLPRNWCHA